MKFFDQKIVVLRLSVQLAEGKKKVFHLIDIPLFFCYYFTVVY